MTGKSLRRVLLYTSAALVLGGLCYAGFVYKAKPDVVTLVNSAEVLAQAGLYDKAIESAQQALDQEPGNAYAHLILGYALGATGRRPEGVEHYRRAVELTPVTDERRPMLRLYYAEAMLTAGQLEDAAREARDVLAFDPGSWMAHTLVGRAAKALGKKEEAYAAYEAARKAAPDHHVPLLLLAELAEENGDAEGAERFLTAAVACPEGATEALLRRACLRGSRNDREGAIADAVAAAGRNRGLAARWLASKDSLEGLRTDPRVAAALAAPETAEKKPENS